MRAFLGRSTLFEMTYRAFAGSATTEELSRQRDCSDLVPMITQCHLEEAPGSNAAPHAAFAPLVESLEFVDLLALQAAFRCLQPAAANSGPSGIADSRALPSRPSARPGAEIASPARRGARTPRFRRGAAHPAHTATHALNATEASQTRRRVTGEDLRPLPYRDLAVRSVLREKRAVAREPRRFPAESAESG